MKAEKRVVLNELISLYYDIEKMPDFLDTQCILLFERNENVDEGNLYVHDILWKHKDKEEYYYYGFEVALKADGSWSNNMETEILLLENKQHLEQTLSSELVRKFHKVSTKLLKEKLEQHLDNQKKISHQRKI